MCLYAMKKKKREKKGYKRKRNMSEAEFQHDWKWLQKIGMTRTVCVQLLPESFNVAASVNQRAFVKVITSVP